MSQSNIPINIQVISANSAAGKVITSGRKKQQLPTLKPQSVEEQTFFVLQAANTLFSKSSQSELDLPGLWGPLKDLYVILEKHGLKSAGILDVKSGQCANTDAMRSLIDKFFCVLFCQDTYSQFVNSSEYAIMKASDVIEQIYGLSGRDLSKRSAPSSKRFSKKQHSFKINDDRSCSNKFDVCIKATKFDPELFQSQKNIFEVIYDLALCIIQKVCGGSKDCDTPETEFNRELANVVIQSFIKHLRYHMHLPKPGQNGFCCYQSVHAMICLLSSASNSLMEVAKEREMISFMFTMLPYLFTEEAKSVAQRLNGQAVLRTNHGAHQMQEFNLNSLIMGQGFQGSQTHAPSMTASQQIGQGIQNTNQKVWSSMHGSAQNLIQPPISAGARNTTTQSSRSPIHQQSSHQGIFSNSLKQKEERKGRDKAFIHKISFNRAGSEPPSANKNAVMPVTEDYADEKSSSSEEQKIGYLRHGQLERVDEEEPAKLSKDGKKRQSGNEKAVPPLMISQVQQVQQQSLQTPSNNVQTAHLPIQQVNNSSSMVMTSYLNMPLGLFGQTMNHLSSNSRQGGASTAAAGMVPNFKLNFVPQTTIAKSRLTRRQMSMSRKNTQKFSSVSNFAQGIYGDEAKEQNSRRFLQLENGANNGSTDQQSNNGGDKSALQRKGPQVPKLNINQLNQDNVSQIQRGDTLTIQMNSTTHALGTAILNNTNALKSSNRSNVYSNQNFENQLQAIKPRSSANMLNHPYQQSQFIRQQHANTQFLQPMNTGVFQESEQNISMYDEMNGSLVDDMGLVEAGQTVMDGAGFMFENAEEKLRQLAIQLGEACLTNDLAALISQKRDIELVKSARKSVNSGIGRISKSSKASFSMNQKFPQRSVSVSYNYEPFFSRKESKYEASKHDSEFSDDEDHQLTHEQTLIHSTRLVFLNLTYLLLKNYETTQIRFLKQPVSALNAFIDSKQYKQYRKNALIQVFEQGTSSSFSFGMLEAEISPIKVKSSISGNLIVYDQNEIAGPSNLIFGSKQLPQKIEQMINYKLSETKLDPEQVIIFKIYQKFTFVNEDIIHAQLNNELANFATRERGLFGNALPYQSRIAKTNSQFIMANQVPNLNLNLPGAPINNFMRPPSQNFLESDTSASSSSNRDAQSQLSNPNIIWASNGIGFDFSSSQSGNSAKSSAKNTFQKERIRKKLDVFLYTVDRRIKHLIQAQFQQNISLEKINITFAKALKSEIQTLNAYLESQRSRIMLYQVIEVNIESLLMIKKTLIDLALKSSIFVADFTKHNSNVTPEGLTMTNFGRTGGGSCAYGSHVRSPNSFNKNSISHN